MKKKVKLNARGYKAKEFKTKKYLDDTLEPNSPFPEYIYDESDKKRSEYAEIFPPSKLTVKKESYPKSLKSIYLGARKPKAKTTKKTTKPKTKATKKKVSKSKKRAK